MNSTSAFLKENALHIFHVVPGIFGNQQSQYLEMIKQMLIHSLNDNEWEVQLVATKALSAFLLDNEEDTRTMAAFGDALPLMLNVVGKSIYNPEEDDTMLKCLIDIAESIPKYLRPQALPVMEMCIKILADPEITDPTRHLALEVVVTLCETAPGMVRKLGKKIVPSLMLETLKMASDLEEDEEWNNADEAQDDDEESNSVVAEMALDRIACGLGGKTVLPHVMETIPGMLSSSRWQERYAALMAISSVGEGCHKQMESLLPELMGGILRFLQDPHPRVRHACCNAIGQMATDFSPTFEKKFADKVVPGLLLLLKNDPNPRVQAHAGAALVNFSEECPKPILSIHLMDLMSCLEEVLSAKLQELVSKGTKLVLEQVVTTIASVADTVEDKFVPFYDRFMPYLKYIIQNAMSAELRLLRGKTIECISLIGLAVGAEKFLPDASEVMNLLLKTQGAVGAGDAPDITDDDPQMSYMISAWARICKILGKQFTQYLPLVMGPVIKAASIKPEITMLDADEMEAAGGDDDDWQYISLGEHQNLGIRTSGLEDKANACQMLVCYARELKEGFAPYAREVLNLMVPLLKFLFHEGVRSAAADSLPALLESAKLNPETQGQVVEMWTYTCPELLKAIENENEGEVLSDLLGSLAKCIEVLGSGCLNEEAMREIFRLLDKTLKEHFQKASERLQQRSDEDYDEVIEEQLREENEDDVYILTKVADVLHSLFLVYRESLYSYFDQILPHFVHLLQSERPPADRQWGICIFDDLIEFTGPSAVKYREYFIHPLLTYIHDNNVEVRQAAAYGLGVLAHHGGEAFATTCAQAIPLLTQVIAAAESRSPENAPATENAISAVAKILKYHASVVDVNTILPIWLSWLPTYEDVEESPHIYGYLLDLMEANHPVVLGLNNANLPHLICILAEALHREAVNKEDPTYLRIKNIIHQVLSNSDLAHACSEVLNQDQKDALQKL
ncbi:unnamed protein product [Darwinula stevensoni]|uniref:TOG domain-containing protein n=1 Tax=Darwinula stevensoni TaxID=69355 RepID=A0A7R9A8U8_9CRUS|nr:unnamed protein product [Darwinula stevensoni]CAG0896808.1 unnamed protein product [Darwinula stevensoni]